MTVKIILWTYEARADGTCNIKLYVNNDGQKKYIKTKFHVQPSDFDKKKGLIKKSHPNHARINIKLLEQKREIENQLIQFGRLDRVGGQKESFIDFLNDYISDIKNGFTGQKESSAKNYNSLLTRLEQYRAEKNLPDIFFNDIDLDFYEDFRRFLFEKCGCRLPGFGKHIKIVKTVMRQAQNKGLHKNETYKHPLFKRYRGTSSNKIYLTEDEILKILNIDLSFDHSLDKERDRFLVSYYFLMRYEDSRAMAKEKFFNTGGRRYLKYKQLKTGHECILPVKNEAWEVLEKRNFDLSHGSNPQSNRNIKLVCAMAGITSEVKQGDQTAPKWKFVTTHTARRSAATNLALQNVNIKIIADLGGWTDIDTLKKYLRASGLDSAIVAKDLDFFL